MDVLVSASFILDALKYPLHVIWPSACPVCGRLAVRICPDCLESLSGYFSKFCVICGGGVPCSLHPDGLVCASASVYNGINRDVIHAMKYANGRRIAVLMGEIMAGFLPRPDAEILVPVPLHSFSDRGYNQTALIAAGASRVWKIPVVNCLRWAAGNSNQASKKNRGERKLPDYAMKSGDCVRGKRVLLVDDVCTTGNTLLAGERALGRAGAKTAGAIVWSRRVLS